MATSSSSAYGVEEADLTLQLHSRGWRILRSDLLRVRHATALEHHRTPEVTAASVSNLARLAMLRYPCSFWPYAGLQIANRVAWLLRNGRLPASLRAFPKYRRRWCVSGTLALPCSRNSKAGAGAATRARAGMKRPEDWLCCQIGAREHYAVPRALARRGGSQGSSPMPGRRPARWRRASTGAWRRASIPSSRAHPCRPRLWRPFGAALGPAARANGLAPHHGAERVLPAAGAGPHRAASRCPRRAHALRLQLRRRPSFRRGKGGGMAHGARPD